MAGEGQPLTSALQGLSTRECLPPAGAHAIGAAAPHGAPSLHALRPPRSPPMLHCFRPKTCHCHVGLCPERRWNPDLSISSNPWPCACCTYHFQLSQPQQDTGDGRWVMEVDGLRMERSAPDVGMETLLQQPPA